MTQTVPKKLVHQLWNGDSRELCKVFKAGRVNCIITDPPYGSNNHSNMAKTVEGKRNARKIENDETPEIAIEIFDQVMDVLLPKTSDNTDMYVFTSHQVLKEWLLVVDNLGRHGFRRCGVLVWQKDGPGMGALDYAWGMAHEFILYLKKGNRERTAPRRSGVFHIPQVRPKDLIHPHEKPVPLLDELLKFSTSPGDFVVDPFAGSFSTGRACKAAGRSCVGIELDENNFKISSDRFSTGETAIV